MLAHELGHWYLSHTVKSFVISLTMMFLQVGTKKEKQVEKRKRERRGEKSMERN